jgi:ElaB/YqjD/DUF883 family membrane-anchored ribosome-binding protein
MSNSTDRTSSDLQREIDADRQLIEDRIGAIHERMSPGQLIDEALAYAKGSGGGEYLRNLGVSLKANPIPVALMGVSMAWLMAKQGASSDTRSGSNVVESRYPLYQTEGVVRRIGPPETENGIRYSHFGDGSGKRWKALTDDSGRRAGDFVDEAGKTYRGFVDRGGKLIEQVADETGAMLDAASGWGSDTWARVKDTASHIGVRASNAASTLSERSASASTTIQEQTSKLNETILTHFRDQPLVGGALAFAIGAAIGAALPHTEAEDAFFGDAADEAKNSLSEEVSPMVEQGKNIASEVYHKAAAVAADAHDTVKDRVMQEVDTFKTSADRDIQAS